MDKMSENICWAADAAVLCRMLHPDRKFREAAGQAAEQLNNYVFSLNADKGLYDKLCLANSRYTIFVRLVILECAAYSRAKTCCFSS